MNRLGESFFGLTFAWTGLAVSLAVGQAGPPPAWSDILEQPAAFYGSAEARTIAEHVLQYQRASGGWPKDVDMTRPPSNPVPARPDSTIDNGATTTQIHLLALVMPNAPEQSRKRFADGALRGIDFLLAAQYENGGWPQFFPLRNDYSRRITFNDDATINVLDLLARIAAGEGHFSFVDDGRRTRARVAVDKGADVILTAQVVVGGSRTAWCAQHDEITLEPRPARSFEPASLSGSESVGIVRFLMRRERTPAVVRAVEAAVAWLKAVRLPDGRWARFYEIGTNRPIFSGRDGIIRYRLEEIEKERQEGYAWYGTWPRQLVEKEYPKWKASSYQLPAASFQLPAPAPSRQLPASSFQLPAASFQLIADS